MVKKLKNIPLIAKFGKIGKRLSALANFGEKKSLMVKALFGAFAILMAMIFNTAFQSYADESQAISETIKSATLNDLPTMLPMAGKGIGAFLALLAFFISLWIREKQNPITRQRLVVVSLWIASIGALLSWLPTDVISTQGVLDVKALAGENPSNPAYFGKVILIAFLILSPPIMAQLYFRLELMDNYVVKAFLSPFFFCMFAFISIWLIFDFTDNGPAFSGLPFSWLGEFYVVQIPYVILFVLPIVILLSLLFAMSKLSKSNEFISMIGAGRSVARILAPLFFIGVYSSLVALALKYEWAPTSAGNKEAIMEEAKNERYALRTGTPRTVKGRWAKRGWMHVNDYASRTWFVGLVPTVLSKPMANVIVWEKNAQGQPITVWKAKQAEWNWETKLWLFTEGKILRYGTDRVPRIEPFDTLELEGWNETPWKVLSSSQNPEFLGMTGLTMFLNANREMPEKDLASFRTNRWNIYAEPALCFAMVLVAAPLGIVYSRKGVLGGVTAAIIIFAVMYIMKGTTMALGQGNRIPPFMGAWTCNFIVTGLGLVLLWFRSRNRDLPKLKNLFSR